MFLSRGALSLLALMPFQDEVAQQARRWIESLRSGSVVEREDAAQKLKELGKGAISELERAGKDPDPEVASRARFIKEVIEISEKIPRPLKDAIPGIAERLATRDDHGWTEAFLEALRRDPGGRRLHPRVDSMSLGFLVDRALRGSATPEEKLSILSLVQSHHLRAAVPTVVSQLGDSEAAIREKAAAFLSEMRAWEAIPQIRKLLGDPRVSMRAGSAMALERLAAREGIPDLLPLLRDESPMVREAATSALGMLGATAAVPDLAARLRDPEPSCRLMAVESIRMLEGRGAASLVILLLEDKDAEVRGSAAGALGSIGGRSAIPALISSLRDENYAVRSEAAGALARLRAIEAIPALTRLLEDPSNWVSGRSAHALGNLGAQEAVPELRRLLKSGPGTRSLAQALGRLGARAAVPDLLDQLRTQKDAQDRAALMGALVTLGAQDEAAPELLRILKDPMDGIRGTAAAALGRLGSKEAIPDLLRLMRDPKTEVELRTSAAQALGAMNASGFVPALIRVLEEKPDDLGLFRGTLVGTFIGVDAREAIPLLLRMVKGEEGSFARGAAARALAVLGVREAELPILELLKDESFSDRMDAVAALQIMDAQHAVERVTSLLNETDSVHKVYVAEALCRLGCPEGLPLFMKGFRDDPNLSLFVLNRFRQPLVWKELSERSCDFLVRSVLADEEGYLESISGRPVDFCDGERVLHSMSFESAEMTWLRGSALGFLERYKTPIVLEAGRIRVLRPTQERAFWEAWWQEQPKGGK